MYCTPSCILRYLSPYVHYIVDLPFRSLGIQTLLDCFQVVLYFSLSLFFSLSLSLSASLSLTVSLSLSLPLLSICLSLSSYLSREDPLLFWFVDSNEEERKYRMLRKRARDSLLPVYLKSKKKKNKSASASSRASETEQQR